ncbi:MAG TPA: SHOCT domain-containing protein [Chloroflexota bacterium]|nr:SHOCT domain-containing protein [Chloroflexota bacterium]
MLLGYELSFGVVVGDPEMMYGYGFGWWGILMMLFWVLIIGGGILLFVWLFRQVQPAGGGAGPVPRQPIEILRERYARGEITREQFEQMRHDLEEG